MTLPDCMIWPSEPCDAYAAAQARILELEAELAQARAERGALRAIVREFVQLEDDDHELTQERLYGKPHTPAYKERELYYRQRRIEFVRRARAIDAARAKEQRT